MEGTKEKIIRYKDELNELQESYLRVKYSRKEITEILKHLENVKLALASLMEEVTKEMIDIDVKKEKKTLVFLILQMIGIQIKNIDSSIDVFSKMYRSSNVKK